MLKSVIVSLTIVFGSLIGILSTGQATPEDIREWATVNGERINIFLKEESNTNPYFQHMLTALLWVTGCVVYLLLFRTRGSERVGDERLSYEEYKKSLPIVGPKGGTGTPPKQEESDTVRKAKARALKSQLICDKLQLESRQDRLTHELATSESLHHRATEKVKAAERHLKEMQEAQTKTSKELESIKSEHKKNDKELQAISEEINKINNQI